MPVTMDTYMVVGPAHSNGIAFAPGVTGGAAIDLATAPPHVVAALAIQLKDLFLTVRTRNVLAGAEIRFLGELIQWTEESFRALQNCGTKTIEEIRDILDSYALKFGTRIVGWTTPEPSTEFSPPIVPNILMADYDEATRAKFHLRTSELGFSSRALNVLTSAGLAFVGDFVQKTAPQLQKLKACGDTTVEEIQNKLLELELSLGMEISDWDADAAEKTRELQDEGNNAALELARNSLAHIPEAQCLEDELRGILGSVVKERDAEIAMKLFGWTGLGRRTLESVGEEYGVTRERIRQIAARATGKIQGRSFATPWLEKALATLNHHCPSTIELLGASLKADGVSRNDFDLSGVQSACDILNRQIDITKAHIGHIDLYGKSETLNKAADFFRLCKRMTSSRGCANFDVVCDELRVAEEAKDSLRRIATIGGVCEWLDEEHRWLLTPAITRNRLSNLVAKVLSVCPVISLVELRRAVARSRRLPIVPPAAVVGAFVERLKLATVSDGRVSALSTFPAAIEAGSAEETLALILLTNGPVLAWDRFQELCVEAGMNPITFRIYLSVSPVVARLSRGIYSLVGAEVPPGLVEDIAKELAGSRKKTEWSWSAKGTLWCVLHLTGTTISSGSASIPAFVESITEGQWQAYIGGQAIDGPIKCANGFAWGLRRPLSNAGAEPDDVCILEFDVSKRIVTLTVGGEELVDIWESGDFELPPPEPMDNEEVDQDIV